MEWSSRNVAHGGILHASKVTYSPETHKFLKRKHAFWYITLCGNMYTVNLRYVNECPSHKTP